MTPAEMALAAIVSAAVCWWPIRHTMRSRRLGARERSLPQVAERLGFELSLAPDIPVPEELRAFPSFDFGQQARVTSVMRGAREGIEVRVLDVQLGGTTASAHNLVVAQTVIDIRDETLALPEFRLEPENVIHKLTETFGAQDIDFDTHPRFSTLYLLRGSSEPDIRAAFTPKVLEWFEQHPGMIIEGKGDRLLSSTSAVLIDAEEIPARVELALEASRVFDRS